MPKNNVTLMSDCGDWKYYVVDESSELTEDSQTKTYLLQPGLTERTFKQCPFKNIIFKNYDVEFIILQGGYLNDLVDEHSDIDLSVYINYPGELIIENMFPTEYISYKGKFIHWTYHTTHSIFDKNYDVELINDGGLMSLQKLTLFHAIYIKNNNYDHPILNNMIKYREDIAKLGAIQMVQHSHLIMEEDIKNKAIKWSKWLSNMLMSYYVLLEQARDNRILMWLKRSKQTTDEEERTNMSAHLLYCFTELLAWAEEHNIFKIDCDKMKAELVQKLITIQ